MKRESFNAELESAFSRLERSNYKEPSKNCLLVWGREYVNEMEEGDFLGIAVRTTNLEIYWLEL